MNVDHCLILAAGLGERMGAIGNVLPKPSWPLFETTLLDAQVAFVSTLGCPNIYINAHHLSQTMIERLSPRYRNQVKILLEHEILGAGGTIHYLREKEKLDNGKLLVINADTFFLPRKPSDFLAAFEHYPDDRAVLLGTMVPPDSGYNEMVSESGKLLSIRPPGTPQKYYPTYSGIGMINLERLTARQKKGSLFELVANFKRETVTTVIPPNFEYRDFGTLELYVENIYEILDMLERGAKSPFLNFLLDNALVKPSKAGKDLYYCAKPKIVNFTQSDKHKIAPHVDKAVILGAEKTLNIEKNGVYYKDIMCPI